MPPITGKTMTEIRRALSLDQGKFAEVLGVCRASINAKEGLGEMGLVEGPLRQLLNMLLDALHEATGAQIMRTQEDLEGSFRAIQEDEKDNVGVMNYVPMPPPGVADYMDSSSGNVPGLITFLSNLLRLVIVAGGIYVLLNIVLAGFGFMSAGGDPKKIADAWAKIWQSLIGLLIMAGAFVLAAIFGWLIFHDPDFILHPILYGP